MKRRQLATSARIAICIAIVGFFVILAGFGARQSSALGGPLIPPSSQFCSVLDLRRGQMFSIRFHTNEAIDFYIMNKYQFEAWKTNGQLKPLVAATSVTDYQLNWSAPISDVYLIIFDNTSPLVEKNTGDTEWFVTGIDLELIAAGSVLVLASVAIVPLNILRKRALKKKRANDAQNAVSSFLPSKIDKRRSRFQILLRREIKFSLSFPILEFLVFLASFIFFTGLNSFPGYVSFSFSGHGDFGTRFQLFGSTLITNGVIGSSLNGVMEAFFTLFMIIGAILIPFSLTAERESGVTLLILSHPVRRHEIFLAKFLAVFILLFSFMSLPSALSILTISARYSVMVPLSAYAVIVIVALLLSALYSAVSSLYSVVVNSTLAASLLSLFTFFLWELTPEIRLGSLQIVSYPYLIRKLAFYLFQSWVPDFRVMNALPEAVSPTEASAAFIALMVISLTTLALSLISFHRKDIE